MMLFELIVKSGSDTVVAVEGQPVAEHSISVSDMEKVIEVEQYLEKMFHLRFHIQQKA